MTPVTVACAATLIAWGTIYYVRDRAFDYPERAETLLSMLFGTFCFVGGWLYWLKLREMGAMECLTTLLMECIPSTLH